VDRDLAAVAALAGDGLDLDGTALDLRDLEFEEAAEEATVGAADDDLRALRGTFDAKDDDADALPGAQVLVADLFAVGEARLGALVEFDDGLARFDTLDGADDDLAFLAAVLVVDLVALGFAEALEDDLLGGLGGDAAGVLGDLFFSSKPRTSPDSASAL